MKVDSVSFVSEGELAVALAVDAFTGGDIRCEAPLALRYGAFLARARWRHASTNEGREDIAINAHSLPSIAITHHGFAQRARGQAQLIEAPIPSHGRDPTADPPIFIK